MTVLSVYDSVLAIAGAQTDEMKAARKVAGANYFPRISTSATYFRLTETEVLQFAQGSFGTFPGLGALPTSQLIAKQGDLNQVLVRNQVVQPLTQLFRVREGEPMRPRPSRASRASAIRFPSGCARSITG